ncbi:MAG: hypothetical protein AVDCRST_MAG11-1225, partial [uncultured Gemmatimonadaceae bacterium]
WTFASTDPPITPSGCACAARSGPRSPPTRRRRTRRSGARARTPWSSSRRGRAAGWRGSPSWGRGRTPTAATAARWRTSRGGTWTRTCDGAASAPRWSAPGRGGPAGAAVASSPRTRSSRTRGPSGRTRRSASPRWSAPCTTARPWRG